MTSSPQASQSRFTVAIAGTTHRTAQVAKCLFEDPAFTIPWILTPAPKAIGRKQIITPNPLHAFATEHSLTTILVDKKLDTLVADQIQTLPRPDFVLVVDFGYLIPDWLLKWPTQAPLNIHPSRLPAWRGTAPGQFVLLAGETESAVTLMIMNEFFDQGPIVHQVPLTVQPIWNQSDYYQASFEAICEVLPTKIAQLATGELTAQPQPDKAPTPLTRKLTKEDSFVSWEALKPVLEGNKTTSESSVTLEQYWTKQVKLPKPLIMGMVEHLSSLEKAQLLERACRAFSPWPNLWTKVPTHKGEKIMKIIACHVEETAKSKLVLDIVHLEGKTPAPWNQVKTNLKE